MSDRPTLAECLEWLNALEEGATIWDTELKFIDRISEAVELLIDETDASNAAHERSRAADKPK
jgi:hypothetical protein